MPHALLPFAATLVRQCFINEYVFDVADDEAQQATALHGMLSARVDADEPIDPTLVALGACYTPLHTIVGADRLATREWPEPIRDLIVQQVRDHQTEQRLRATIPALTPIADATSEKVRQQYEENPYPRWTKTVPDQQPLGIDQYIHTRFSGSVELGFPGPFGYTIRVLPSHPLLASRADLGLVAYPDAPAGMSTGDLR